MQKNIKAKKSIIDEWSKVIGDKLEQKQTIKDLITKIEEIFSIYLEQKQLKIAEFTTRDIRMLVEMYNAIMQRDKNLNNDIIEFIDQILKLKDAEITEEQANKLLDFLKNTRQVNIYIDKGELTDPIEFTKARSKLLEDVSNDTEDFTGN